jgi:hypothetical protein
MTLPPVTFPTLGWQVIDWIEAMLPHGPGDVQGDDWEIDDEFALHICWLYRVWPQDHPLAGRRLVHRGVLSRPKGRAKSELGGGLVCAEALGPVRCDGFDARGDPVGRPVRYPFIRCLATEEEQAGNTYDNVHYMLSEGEVANQYRLDVGLTRTYIKEPGGGEIVPSTAASASKDGGKETFAVADETHLYITKELRKMYRTVSRNTGKRKEAEPWMFDTTTAWDPGEHSVAEQTADKYAHLTPEEGTTTKGVLYDHRMGSEPKIFKQNASLIKAMREGYGPAAEWMDFERICRIIRDAEDPEAEAYRYWLNRPRAAASHWLAPHEIQAVLRPETILEKGQPIALGFDGSLSDDHTALWLCTADGHLVPVGIWAPQEGQEEDWEAPQNEVTETVDWAFEHFRVVRDDCDPAWWQDEVGRWAEKHGSPPVVEWWTNQERRMAIATGALRTAIRKQQVTIDPIPLRTDPQTRSGKPLAVWHFENARTLKVRVRLEDKAEEAHILRKERRGSPLKIDSAVAAVLAYRARHEARDEFDVRVPERAAWQ